MLKAVLLAVVSACLVAGKPVNVEDGCLKQLNICPGDGATCKKEFIDCAKGLGENFPMSSEKFQKCVNDLSGCEDEPNACLATNRRCLGQLHPACMGHVAPKHIKKVDGELKSKTIFKKYVEGVNCAPDTHPAQKQKHKFLWKITVGDEVKEQFLLDYSQKPMVLREPVGDEADIEITISDKTYVDLAEGKIDGVTAFTTGAVKSKSKHGSETYAALLMAMGSLFKFD